MKLFVGLGNPGSKYSHHRHNIGQVVLERLAKRFSGAPWSQTAEGMVLECRIGSEQIAFLKPATKMNESGRSVADAQSRLGVDADDIFIFYDDVDLAPGRLKVRCGGGSGGHNGVSSVSACIGSEYHRVRIGVGRPREGTPMRDHVLGNLTKSDELWLAPLAEAMADALDELIQKRHSTFLNKVARAAPPLAAADPQDPPTAPLLSFESVSRFLQRLPDRGKQARKFARGSFRTYRAKSKRSQSQATFIAITGSSAKTSTTNLIAHILRGHGNVLVQEGANILDSTIKTLSALRRDHDYAVMELGSSGPGTIGPMARMVRPDIAVITTVGMEHYSAFRSREAVAIEKASLVKELQASGVAILNADDPNVSNMVPPAGARIVRYGSAGADYRSGDIDASVLGQLSFTMAYKGRSIRLRTRLTGLHNYLAVCAAAACAFELGVPEELVVERIASFEPVFNRMSVHKVPGGPVFLLDANKAPVDTLPLSINALKDCSAPRKRFVLSGLSDYPGNPGQRFRDAYKMARDVADEVIFIGQNSHRSQATQADKDAGRFREFASVRLLSQYIKETAIEDEVLLLKGPSSTHIERLFLDWTTPVRCWEDACGKRKGCLLCGLVSQPFEQHRGKRRKSRWYSLSRKTERPAQ